MDARIYLLQFALREKGFYQGRLDGDEGPLTRAAFAAWQSSIAAEDRTFEDVVLGWNLRHFTAAELLTKGASNARLRLNTDPPPALWSAIRPAVLAADEARARLGSGIIITSAYRAPAYNRAIGGAANSFHTRFQALDLIPTNGQVTRLRNIMRDLRSEGYPGAAGIGTYRTFVHVDNGPRRDW